MVCIRIRIISVSMGIRTISTTSINFVVLASINGGTNRTRSSSSGGSGHGRNGRRLFLTCTCCDEFIVAMYVSPYVSRKLAFAQVCIG